MSCVPKQLSSSKAHFIDKCFPNIESKKMDSNHQQPDNMLMLSVSLCLSHYTFLYRVIHQGTLASLIIFVLPQPASFPILNSKSFPSRL